MCKKFYTAPVYTGMMLLEPWPLAALLSIVLVVIASVTLMVTIPGHNMTSVSRYIAHHRRVFIAMGALLTICGATFVGFLLFWLTPEYNLPPSIYPISAIAYAALLGLAWIPDIDEPGKKLSLHVLHFFCGGVLGLMCIVVIMLCLLEPLPIVSYIVGMATIVFCLSCYILFFISDFMKRNFLQFELIAVGLLFSSIISLMLKV